VNLLYPRLGKENSPRLMLEWLPSGIIANQSLDLSPLHSYLRSFIIPTSNPFSLSLVTLDSHIHHDDGDHQFHSLMLFSKLKEDPTKLKEVKEVAKLCRTIMAMPDELAPGSFNLNPVFVTCFGGPTA